MKFTVLSTLSLQLLAATACLLPSERPGNYGKKNNNNKHRLTARQAIGSNATQPQAQPSNKTDTGMPISPTNRFSCGSSSVPRGVGSVDNPSPVEEIMSLSEIKSAVKALEARFDDVEFFEMPYRTYENRTVFGARIGGGGGGGGGGQQGVNRTKSFDGGAYSVLMQAAIHPRERGSPDHLVYFVSDLLWARKEGRGLRYGGSAYTAAQVSAALALGIVAIPVVNPDGMAHDQQAHTCWRKNRNAVAASATDPRSVGVDLNRNFDLLWDYRRTMAPGTMDGSDDPAMEYYHGAAAFSEPETRNVRWVMDQHPRLAWYMDLHSAAQVVLHGWCHDAVQADDPAQNWKNPAYDGKRGTLFDPAVDYAEYMDRRDWDALSVTAARMASAMQLTKDEEHAWSSDPYVASQGVLGFGTSTGCSIDHAYSRHLEDATKSKILGFGFEFGEFNYDLSREDCPIEECCPFYPTVSIFNHNNKAVAAGLMELLMAANRNL
ncbi:hypothetical protein PpBr36_02561 [Pyricularia pennisetigena]|uniref:hypothetical protein n=1 Tax=Pyricularia pennisetigena TaxID=1578925 RepID=UPI001152F209|nr:hypothetical protein PpBr36_02561 [Pyricularia pennisetigena]TLS30690.1 hypothetical protein PpBr36_02561 [Pyricularia pennisetigena]